MSLILVFLAQEQEQDAFFETAFDGEWTGYVRMNTAQEKWDFPMVLNLNIHGDTGIGFAFLSDDLQTAPTGFKLYELQNIQIRGKKITVQIDSALSLLTNKVEDAFIHTIKLSYKNATDTLKGSFTSSNPDLGRGSVLLYHQDSSKEIQQVWTGSVTIDKKKTPLIMQLVQTEADSNLRQQSQAAEVNGVGSRQLGSPDLGRLFE
jgi:hypothetical protein